MTDRCALCPTNPDGRYCNRPVPPSGPSRSSILFIGAGPAKTENRTGSPYSGLAGQELDATYLPLANLYRDDVAITNASSCWDGSDRTPSTNRVLTCARHHLPSLLDCVRPETVVLMGGVTQRLADMRLRLDIHHGIPQRTSILGGAWEGWVWPMYEPALGMRDTGMMAPLMADFTRLGQWLRGEWAPPVPSSYALDYQELIDVWSFDAYLNQRPVIQRMALDGEDHGPDVWSLQISHTPHTGRLIRATNHPVLRALAEYARESDVTWILHEANGDDKRCHRVGVEIPKWQDTMQEAFHICSLPQGLKALVYRLFGHQMKSWEDVVWPASVDKWVEWCEDALALAGTRPETVTTELKRGHCKDCGHYHSKGACKCGCPLMDLTRTKVEYRPSALESILKHIHRYTVQTRDDDEPYNPWEELPAKIADGLRGRMVEKGVWEELEQEVGTPPVLGIGNADFTDALDYACLAANSRVRTRDGLRLIKDLVTERFSGDVLSVSRAGDLEWKPVIGWIRNRAPERVVWKSLTTEYDKDSRWKFTGTRYTPDHRILTAFGWKAVRDIELGEIIYLPLNDLDSVQEQVVLGSILGDGCLQKRNGELAWASLKVSHNIRQKAYLYWTADLLGNLISSPPVMSNSIKPIMIAGRWAYPKEHWSFTTIHHPVLGKIREYCYPVKGRKIPPNLKNLDALGLAIWYQDDGSIVRHGNTGRPRFYTLSFKEEETAGICDVLRDRFGFEPNMFKMGNGWAISINGESADAFFELVSEFVHPCMSYKLPPHWRGRFNPNPLRIPKGLIEARVINVFDNPVNKKRRDSCHVSYCLDVADNHNFCTIGEVAHNCADADWTLQLAGRLEVERAGNRWHVDEGDFDV